MPYSFSVSRNRGGTDSRMHLVKTSVSEYSHMEALLCH